MVAEPDVERRVAETHRGQTTAQEAFDVSRVGGISAHDQVLAKLPDGAGRAARLTRSLQGGVEVEVLRAVVLFARLEGSQERLDLVVSEAGQAQVNVAGGVEFGQHPGQERLIPLAADLV